VLLCHVNKNNEGYILASNVVKITERQLQILKELYNAGKSVKVHTIVLTQNELSDSLGITRQALSNHLRKLRDIDFIRTGRGFIDLTNKALEALGESVTEAFVFIQIDPEQRIEAYDKIKSLRSQRLFRVTGSELDLIAQVGRAKLDSFLRDLVGIAGVVDIRLVPKICYATYNLLSKITCDSNWQGFYEDIV
jgi:DNA-binding Lrp family transcriptional regulator